MINSWAVRIFTKPSPSATAIGSPSKNKNSIEKRSSCLHLLHIIVALILTTNCNDYTVHLARHFGPSRRETDQSSCCFRRVFARFNSPWRATYSFTVAHRSPLLSIASSRDENRLSSRWLGHSSVDRTIVSIRSSIWEPRALSLLDAPQDVNLCRLDGGPSPDALYSLFILVPDRYVTLSN